MISVSYRGFQTLALLKPVRSFAAKVAHIREWNMSFKYCRGKGSLLQRPLQRGRQRRGLARFWALAPLNQ
jgi:hypothetical protein